MWLLKVKTLELEQFFETNAPEYAILSHTWGNEEVSFQDMQSKGMAHKAGYKKIEGCCAQAASDGYKYVWVDTCCIDKTSSAELSEAINSMFQWYENADICYVYLADVPSKNSVMDPGWDGMFDVKGIFKNSRWFTRGWTLQELIAPTVVEFYAWDWSAIGTKTDLQSELADITGIECEILGGAPLSKYNVAERISWAAFRETTRIEDRAYSLLGILQVNMPLLYGEGKRAFIRMQEELMKSTEDYSIFAWSATNKKKKTHKDQSSKSAPEPEDPISPLADDPSRFLANPSQWKFSDLVPIPRHAFKSQGVSFDSSLAGLGLDDTPPTLTGRGLRICLPLAKYEGDTYLACIYLKLRTTNQLVCIKVRRTEPHADLFRREDFQPNFLRLGSSTVSLGPEALHFGSATLLPTFKRFTVYVDQKISSTKEQDSKERALVLILDAESLERSADLLLVAGNNAEAEEKFTNAWSKRKRALGAIHEATLESLEMILKARKRQKRHDKSEELETTMVELRKSAGGEYSSATLKSRTALAWIISKQPGGLMDAEKLLLEVVETSEEARGSNNSITLNSMAKLMAIYWKQGQKEKAKEWQQRFSGPFAEFLGDERPKVSHAMRNFMWISANSERWKEDDELLKQTMKVYKKMFGKDDRRTLLITSYLAKTYMANGRKRDAINLGEYAFKKLESVFGEDDPDTVATGSMVNDIRQS